MVTQCAAPRTWSFFGYKNHVNVDRTHKLIPRYAVTNMAVHGSRKLNGLLHRGNASKDVFGDSAYRSAATEATLRALQRRSTTAVRRPQRVMCQARYMPPFPQPRTSVSNCSD